MTTEPYFHVGKVFRTKQSNGLVSEDTINLSGIPFSASDEFIHEMAQRALYANQVIAALWEAKQLSDGTSLLEHRVVAPQRSPAPAIDMSAFAPAAPAEEPSLAGASRVCVRCHRTNLSAFFHTEEGLICEDCNQPEEPAATESVQASASPEPTLEDSGPIQEVDLTPDPTLLEVRSSLTSPEPAALVTHATSELTDLQINELLAAHDGTNCFYCTDPFADLTNKVCDHCREDLGGAKRNLLDRLKSQLGPAPEEKKCLKCSAKATIDLGDGDWACADCIRSQTWTDPEPAIPDETDISTGSGTLGAHIEFPPAEWLAEPITEAPHEGSAGQLIALNAGLSSIGYGGKKRHSAALAILTAFGPIHDQPARKSLTSLRELSKAEAHICLSWLETPRASTLAQLKAAVDALTGQGVLAAA